MASNGVHTRWFLRTCLRTRRATDRDLEMKKMNAWMCAPRTTDPDHANVIFNLNCNNCNACNDCNFSAAALFSN